MHHTVCSSFFVAGTVIFASFAWADEPVKQRPAHWYAPTVPGALMSFDGLQWGATRDQVLTFARDRGLESTDRPRDFDGPPTVLFFTGRYRDYPNAKYFFYLPTRQEPEAMRKYHRRPFLGRERLVSIWITIDLAAEHEVRAAYDACRKLLSVQYGEPSIIAVLDGIGEHRVTWLYEQGGRVELYPGDKGVGIEVTATLPPEKH